MKTKDWWKRDLGNEFCASWEKPQKVVNSKGIPRKMALSQVKDV